MIGELESISLNGFEDLLYTRSLKNGPWTKLQRAALKKHFPSWHITADAGWLLTLTGELEPTGYPYLTKILVHRTKLLSNGFLVRQRLGPRVQVPEIPVKPLPPHIYPILNHGRILEGFHLCLFDWREAGEYRQWRESDLLGKTTLYWAARWLTGYEIWLMTGKWKCGGTHPENGEEQCKDQSRGGGVLSPRARVGFLNLGRRTGTFASFRLMAAASRESSQPLSWLNWKDVPAAPQPIFLTSLLERQLAA